MADPFPHSCFMQSSYRYLKNFCSPEFLKKITFFVGGSDIFSLTGEIFEKIKKSNKEQATCTYMRMWRIPNKAGLAESKYHDRDS